MFVYEVVFGEASPDKKKYYYKSKLPLFVNRSYLIQSEHREYSTPVTVLRAWEAHAYDRLFGGHDSLVEIVKADCTSGPKVPDFKIKLVKFDMNKMVTVIKWTDNTVTKVKCSYMDPFDKEKAIALCYMKRWCFDNRSCFNNVFKKYCEEEQKDEN